MWKMAATTTTLQLYWRQWIDVDLGQDKALWRPGLRHLWNCQMDKDKAFLAPQLGLVKLGVVRTWFFFENINGSPHC